MHIRDTEGSKTTFRTDLFNDLGIVELQGLLMNENWKPTAGVEAIDYEPNEPINVIQDIGENALAGKLALTDALNVPLYVVTSRNQEKLLDLRFDVIKITKESSNIRKTSYRNGLEPEEFARFWGKYKGTDSVKPLPDANTRIKDSNVDNVLREADLEWGGNIDGILTNDGWEVKAIIESRKTNQKELNSYDPNNYFHYRGGDYNTWKPLYNISNELSVPLILLTFKHEKSQCGCAYVDNMSSSKGLTYEDGITPDQNLLAESDVKTELRSVL